MNTVLSPEQITKACQEDALKLGEAGFFECIASGMQAVATSQDTFTRSELAKAVREMIKKNLYSNCKSYQIEKKERRSAYIEALQAVLKVIEAEK